MFQYLKPSEYFLNVPKTLTAEAGWTHQDVAVTFPNFRDAARVQIYLQGSPVEVRAVNELPRSFIVPTNIITLTGDKMPMEHIVIK